MFRLAGRLPASLPRQGLLRDAATLLLAVAVDERVSDERALAGDGGQDAAPDR